MSSKHALTEGALQTMMKGGAVENAIMQILGSKKIMSNTPNKDRYRILLSDGKYLISHAMLTTQNNSFVENSDLAKFSVIKIKKFITSVINNSSTKSEKHSRILVVLDMEVLSNGSEVGSTIGDPQPLPEDGDGGSSNAGSSNAGPSPAKKPAVSGSNGAGGRYVPPVNGNTSMNGSLSEQLTHPISSLSPYQNKWVIKARIMNKSPIRSWSNSRSEGKLFSIDLVDESGEIRCTGFREMVEKLYDVLQVDKVYYISKCQLKMANKQFNQLKNDYEMVLTSESIVQECVDDTTGIPMTQYNFVPIENIANMEINSLCDIIGVCKQASDLQTFTAKSTGRELKKRELTLVDTSKAAVNVTLWGHEAENYNYENPVVAIKGAKVGEFGGGKNLMVSMGSTIKYNPDIEEAFALRGWYDNEGQSEDAQNISAKTGSGNFQANWLSFKEVRDLGLGSGDKGDYYQTKGTVLLVKHENCTYKACPQDSCNKKVVDLENGRYRCEKCNQEYPNFKYRILGNMNVGDWSGNQWLSMFSTEAEQIVGKTAAEVGAAVEQGEDEVTEIMSNANFKEYVLRCRVKMETYNDESRLKTVAVRVEPVNHKEYNSFLISRIQQLIGE